MAIEDRGTGDAELAAEIAVLEDQPQRGRTAQGLVWLRELQKRRAATTPDRERVHQVVREAVTKRLSVWSALAHDPICRAADAIADRAAEQLSVPAPKPHHAGRQAIPAIDPSDTPELREAIAREGERLNDRLRLEHRSRVHAAADKIDRGANVVATPTDEDHPLGLVSVTPAPRRIPVGVFIDNLERTAKLDPAIDQMRQWITVGGLPNKITLDHIIAAQPAAILALIATVREMIPLVKNWAASERAAANRLGITDPDFDAIVDRALFVEVP